MTLLQKFKRLHYAWIILFAACVLGIVSRADSASFSVFIDPLVERFCWSHGDISLAYAIAFIAGMPAVMIMGWLGDRFGARFLMIGASFLISAGTLLCTLHVNDDAKGARAEALIREAVKFTPTAPKLEPLIQDLLK